MPHHRHPPDAPARGLDRRGLLRRLPAAGALALGWPALAQEAWPTRPITFMCPYTAGGVTDAVSRRSGQVVGRRLGQNVVVENRAGASGAIGYAAIARAAPDGHTVGLYGSNVTLLYVTSADVPYNPLRDFTFIAGLTLTPMGVAVRADSPYKTFAELVAAARARPGAVSMAHSGPTTGGHLVCAEMELLGVRFNQVPYRGAEWIQALAGGHVDAIAGPLAYAAQVDAGAFRLLATFGDARTAKYAQVPTARDAGFPITVQSTIGVMGPAGLSPRTLAALQDAYRAWTDDPDFRKTLADYQMEPWVLDSAAMTAAVRERYRRDLALAEHLGIAVRR